MRAGVPPFPCTGFRPADTLLETADGAKATEDIKPGDNVAVRPPIDPEKTDGLGVPASRSP